MSTDLQKKDELRRELRLLQLVAENFRVVGGSENMKEQTFTRTLVLQRIEDIQKALED